MCPRRQGRPQPDRVIQVVIGKDESIELKVQDKRSTLGLKDPAGAVLRVQSDAPNSAVVMDTCNAALARPSSTAHCFRLPATRGTSVSRGKWRVPV